MSEFKIKWIPNKSINQDSVAKYLSNSIATGKFSNYGPNVILLEQKIRELLGIDASKAIIVVNSGTSALQSITAGIDMDCGKRLRWATQSFTFPPSAQAFLADADIIDIDNGGGLDINQVNLDTTDGIIVTNVFGNIVDID